MPQARSHCSEITVENAERTRVMSISLAIWLIQPWTTASVVGSTAVVAAAIQPSPGGDCRRNRRKTKDERSGSAVVLRPPSFVLRLEYQVPHRVGDELALNLDEHGSVRLVHDQRPAQARAGREVRARIHGPGRPGPVAIDLPRP